MEAILNSDDEMAPVVASHPLSRKRPASELEPLPNVNSTPMSFPEDEDEDPFARPNVKPAPRRRRRPGNPLAPQNVDFFNLAAKTTIADDFFNLSSSKQDKVRNDGIPIGSQTREDFAECFSHLPAKRRRRIAQTLATVAQVDFKPKPVAPAVISLDDEEPLQEPESSVEPPSRELSLTPPPELPWRRFADIPTASYYSPQDMAPLHTPLPSLPFTIPPPSPTPKTEPSPSSVPAVPVQPKGKIITILLQFMSVDPPVKKKFRLHTTDCFDGAFRVFAEQIKHPLSNLVFTCNHVTLFRYGTPLSLNMDSKCIVDVYTKADHRKHQEELDRKRLELLNPTIDSEISILAESTTTASAAGTTAAPPADIIRLKLQTPKSVYKLAVKKSCTVAELISSFGKCHDGPLDEGSVRLLFDGETLERDGKLEDTELEDGDTVEVRGGGS
ncbi:hypothetical protein BC832DRAFT_545267 [Gaertneriomyces semiglobifer]|nr:hypothetical protein BC832DRAFT_545267 [Gaertneriomyces semiglobifer]